MKVFSFLLPALLLGSGPAAVRPAAPAPTAQEVRDGAPFAQVGWPLRWP
ncbi:hypothetical protein ACFQ48_16270 [Hymenobacter caeli]|uniref:Uncharacterized protein n=1 Tax=Hymenobacter caeli TaxID=2735894 RepID=A0ABX2FV54_9BACT|nr:hypothetical protein [Hymenobacter caeli]NRT20703.1 hypothetical protein [Hymenobacter caeli]